MKMNNLQAILSQVDKKPKQEKEQENKPKPKPKPKKKAVKKAKPIKKQKKAPAKQPTKDELLQMLLKMQKDGHKEAKDKDTKLRSFSLSSESKRKLKTISDRLDITQSKLIEILIKYHDIVPWPKNQKPQSDKKLVSLTLSHKAYAWLKRASKSKEHKRYSSVSAFLDDFCKRELPETKEIPEKRK